MCIIVLPVNILVGVVHRLLGPHDHLIMLLLPSKFEGNQLKHTQGIAIFLKCAKRKRKCKEHKTNFEGTYLYDGQLETATVQSSEMKIGLKLK